MQSLRYLYRIGNGPSSSHTMGPIAAARRFLTENGEADAYRVTLYGSLAKTGKGHMTDTAVLSVFDGRACEIVFDTASETERHPNMMDIVALRNGAELARTRYYSIGGGEVIADGEESESHAEVYQFDSFTAISEYCRARDMRIWQYVEEREGVEIWDYLAECWRVMQDAIARGIAAEGVLHGGLGTQRKARYLYRQKHIDESEETKTNRLICAFAYAVSEENAGGGLIVTAPTCGACGVLPATLKYLQTKRRFSDEQILHALATASVIGNLIKKRKKPLSTENSILKGLLSFLNLRFGN